ncbi:helix-turn-helix transcriptional regulator [Ectothiorhodospiraceae bacterium 2226]|nr:helix-turn-helix transcriptional regulator [Ectothiorhodospiraceae bacterium 2226]
MATTPNNDDWLAVADAAQAAAVGAGAWLVVLEALAAITGSRAGELIGLGAANTVPFNWVSELGPDWAEEFLAIGGGDPAVNPFVRAGADIPALTVLASADFITREERRRNPFLIEHVRRFDIPYICLTPLIKERDGLVGLAVMRSSRQGEIGPLQREVFATLAPHLRAAVRTQMALENQGAQLMAGALEAVSLAAFVCDRGGSVRALTPAAETLVSGGGPLRLRYGLLSTASAGDSRALREAIGAATDGLVRPGAPTARTLLVRNEQAQPLVLEVVPLPRREFAFGFEPRALVVVRTQQADPARMRMLLRAAFGLTDAETDVALRLVEGQPPEAIAAGRGASLGTVRTQIRAIYAKLDVHHLSELVARINQLR